MKRFLSHGLFRPVVGLVLAGFLFTSCGRPQIREAQSPEHDFVLHALNSYKKVFRIEVWSHTRDIRLWELGLRPGDAYLDRGELRYGRTPKVMKRVFPKGANVPAQPRPAEILIVRIQYYDDRFLAPGSGSARKAFRINNAGRWLPVALPEGTKKPIWSSEAARKTFINGIRGELTGPGRALFLRPAPVGSARARTIEALRQSTGEKDLRKAYIHLRRQESLNLTSLQIEDITVLADLENLRRLYLNTNRIRDVAPLKGLTNLEILSLGENPIGDATALAALTKLTLLDLNETGLRTLEFVRNLKQLHTLYAARNCLKDIAPLRALKKLDTVKLNHNRITDVSPLVGPGTLRFIELTGNPLKNAELLNKRAKQGARILYPGFEDVPGEEAKQPPPACSTE